MNKLTLIIFICIMPFAMKAQNPSEGKNNQEVTDSLMLHEVVVKGTRPVSRIKADGVVTTVQGTPLQQLGTARDVLGFMPGVVSTGENIEVFGKGAPVIYINGRKVYSKQELDQLSSTKVKDVTVINNPGARYASDVNAVIRITTVKTLGDGFAIDNRTVIGYKNHLSANDVLSMNYRHKGLDVFSTLEYDYSKGNGTNQFDQNTWSPSKQYRTNLNTQATSRSQLYDGKLGFNYILSEDHSLGFYYQISHKPLRSIYVNKSCNFTDELFTSESENKQYRKDNDTQHLIDGYYTGKWGPFTSDITLDILWHNNDQLQNISENTSVNSLTDDSSRGRMIAGKLNLSRKLWKGELSFGTEYTNSRRTDVFYSDLSQMDGNDNKQIENNIGTFIETQQRFGNTFLQLGLRYEHIESDYFENGLKMSEQSPTYNEVLPSATLVFPVARSTFQIGYARKYTRPLYSQLSSTITYSNPNIYETGNPHLKTTYYDNVMLNYKWKGLMIMASYSHITNPIVQTAISYKDSPDITLLSKANSDKAIEKLQVMAQYQPGMIGNFYYPAFAAGIMSQFYDIDFMGESMHLNNPMGIVKWMNIFMLPKGYRLNANLSWRSEGDSENANLGQSWQIDLNASKTFGKHWEVKLAMNDILNTAADTHFTMFSNNRTIKMNKHNSTRAVELTVSYRFNTSKSKYLGKGAGNSEAERLK